ncbi:hypothetical protein [uncultured Corynebacterium sp.]|uniref:hypothetical protein n=1 Tax=uncultured Corynebacterium sp. TaxID=159447 RepID=UPI0025EF5303|nr:hypothetical protein [uncultured Corynebacterium sp.]
MTTDLATLEVLRDLDGTLEEVQGRAGQIDRHATANTVLSLTVDLPQVMEGIGGLKETGADLGALRVLAHARALAAKTTGDHDDQFTAAHLAATLALATGDPQNLAAARALMEDAADAAVAAADAEDAAAEEPELVDAEVGVERSAPADLLRECPTDPAGDDAWSAELDRLAAEVDRNPAAVTASVDELNDIILLSLSAGTDTVRHEVLHRLFTLHRLQQEAEQDPVAVTRNRATFLDTVNALVPGDMSATTPLEDRILLNGYRSTAEDATPQQRLNAAQQLTHLHAGRGDRRGMAEALLRAGEELQKLSRMAEMYDTYQRALNLSQDVGATDIRIWATIRLAFAQYIAGDKMTATQMLLDQDAELPVEHLDGEKDKTAMAEAKVALANLFSEAGDRDGKSFFLTQAVDLFEEVGQADSAARYRAQL